MNRLSHHEAVMALDEFAWPFSTPSTPGASLAFAAREAIAPRRAKPRPAAPAGTMRVGVICNPRSFRNQGAAYAAGTASASRVLVAAPRTHQELIRALNDFATARIDMLVIDGGDGTIRDVLTGAGMIWPRDLPLMAVIPSGRTNALATDLDLPAGWTINDAIASASLGRITERRPLEVSWVGNPQPLRGFLFGAGAFVTGTEMATGGRPGGAFNGAMVGVAVGTAVLHTIFGDDADKWRAGTPMCLHVEGAVPDHGRKYLLLASTLHRLPMGLKVFGRRPGGMRMLDVDGPPRRILATLPAILTGHADAWLARQGCRRREARAFEMDLEDDFILDGERYPGGSLTVRPGPTIRFATR